MRRWLAATAALLVLSVMFEAAAQSLPETLRKVRPGIVGVGTYEELRRPPSRLHGTGFAVADGSFVLTNFHVVPRNLDAAREVLAVFVGRGENARVVQASVVAADETYDLAVLKMAGTILPPLELGDDAVLEEGMDLAFTGFPIAGVLGLYPATHRGILAARTPIAVPQIRGRTLDPALIRQLRNRFEVLQLDATAYPGNSGSPLYDPATGVVYGIVNSVFVKGSRENVLRDPSGITYAVPIRHARALLERENIDGWR